MAHDTALQTFLAPPDDKTLADAYIYLLGRALVLRQERLDLTGPEATYNKIKYVPLRSTAYPNPNLDVAYLEAWVAVDEHSAALLDIPEIKSRYYTVQILDEWGEVIVNINERTFPSQPFGLFALIAPNSRVLTPPSVARIELHGFKAKIIARIELRDSPAIAVELQNKFRLRLMDMPLIQSPPDLPLFDNKTLIGAELFDNVDALLISALDISPAAAELQQKAHTVAAYAASSDEARAMIGKRLREKVVPWFLDFAATMAFPYNNNWRGGGLSGNYGRDYRLRSVINLYCIWANIPDEALYFNTTRDVLDNPLHGSKSYLMRFPPQLLPGGVVDGYWSLGLVDVPDFRVCANAHDRYALNSYTPLEIGADDALTIAVGPHRPAHIPESNWLPSPEGRFFALTFRAYVPKDIIKRGAWSPPPLIPLG